MKILFAAYEAAPIVKYGGLGDVVGSLPKALSRLGLDVRLALPGYPFIKRVDYLPNSQVPVDYFDSQDYFGDPNYESYNSGDERNRQRFVFFSQAVVNALSEGDFKPDLVHVHDWHTALIPAILKTRSAKDSRLAKIATLLTIHNLAYHGDSDPQVLKDAGLTESSCQTIAWDINQWNPKGVRDLDLLTQGIIHADLVNTVSPSYLEEVKTLEFGEGLEEIIQGREGRFYGVLNGIDYEIWNPDTDNYLMSTYNIESYTVKRGVNKKHLRKILRLGDSGDQPLLAFVGRLARQKGIELILNSIEEIIQRGASIVVLGTGDDKYESTLAKLAKRWPGRVAVELEFNESLAHQIYAGADLILVPSRFEPCGLVQLIAMRYGMIPVAHAVGGLKDTIEDGKTGFLFQQYSVAGLLSSIDRALECYPGQEWRKMIGRAMNQDFSWDRSAKEYVKLYQKAIAYRKIKIGGE